jgi:hypothetical protein
MQDDGSVLAGKSLTELAERAPRPRDHARLLPELPSQRLLRGFPRLQVPPEHVPHSRVECAFRFPLAEQDERRVVAMAVLVTNQHGAHADPLILFPHVLHPSLRRRTWPPNAAMLLSQN